MDYDVILADVLALLQRETSEQFCRGAWAQRREKGVPAEPISTILDVCHNPLSMKGFHGV
jgi:hypothetical protein